jgi:hypothetical protein
VNGKYSIRQKKVKLAEENFQYLILEPCPPLQTRRIKKDKTILEHGYEFGRGFSLKGGWKKKKK